MANIHGLGDGGGGGGRNLARNAAFLGQQRDQDLNNGRIGNEDYPEFIRCFFVQRRDDPRKETFL